jgi:CheY-like chemotaxis protein
MKPTTTSRLLIVEDNEDDLFLLKRELSKAQLSGETLIFSAAEPALKALNESGPSGPASGISALFLDIHLPQMTGLDFLRIVRSLEGMGSLPALVMSSAATPEAFETCRQLNARALIPKPVKAAELLRLFPELFHT